MRKKLEPKKRIHKGGWQRAGALLLCVLVLVALMVSALFPMRAMADETGTVDTVVASEGAADDARVEIPTAQTTEDEAPIESVSGNKLSAQDAYDLLYLDQTSPVMGTSNYVAVSLKEGFVANVQVTLTVVLPDGTVANLAACDVEGQVLLFEVPVDQLGTYVLKELRVPSADGMVTVDLTSAGTEATTFASQTAEEITDGDVVAYAQDGKSDQVMESDSLADALASASGTTSGTRRVRRAPGAGAGASTPTNFKVVTIALDPGHGSNGDPGTPLSGLPGNKNAAGDTGEQQVAYKIAQDIQEILSEYVNVNVVMLVTPEQAASRTAPLIKDRIAAAHDAGADVVVSLHLNASNIKYKGSASGCEVHVPSAANTTYHNDVVAPSKELGQKVIDNISKLLARSGDDGLHGTGMVSRLITPGTHPKRYSDYLYPDGSYGDWLKVNRLSREAGIPSVLIEHCFADNEGDAERVLADDAEIQKLAQADAQALIEQYHLVKASEQDVAGEYDYEYYVEHHPEALNAAKGSRAGVLGYYLSTGKAAGHVAKAPSSEKTVRSDVAVMHRLYNPYTGEHFYTADTNERDTIVGKGWRYEGVGWYAPKTSSTPVYRLYNKYAGDHHYTVSKTERDHLVKVGWTYESVGWYSEDAKSVPLYRQYNPYAWTGTHNYTADKHENEVLVGLGWRAEGIGWYGTDPYTKPAPVPSNAKEDAGKMAIMGISPHTQDQMIAALKAKGKYPSALASKGASSPQEFVSALCTAAENEGVRADVLFGQAMLETGWLRFGGDVKVSQCNFGGLGATGGGNPGLSFPDVYTGLLAQAQHLKAYASTDSLNLKCVDPRFSYVKRGCAPCVTGLNGKWASGSNYGEKIASIVNSLGSY